MGVKKRSSAGTPPSVPHTLALVEITQTCLLTLKVPPSIEGGHVPNQPDQTEKETEENMFCVFCFVRAHGAVKA